MRFTIGSDEYRLRFAHLGVTDTGSFIPTDAKDEEGKPLATNRATICEIQRSLPRGEWQGIAGSYTICSKKDIFSRASGRKTALTFAVNQIKDKSLRRGIWQAYLAPRTEKPKKGFVGRTIDAILNR